MIITKYFRTREDGVRYSEAVDPAELGRTYTETDEPVEGVEPVEEGELHNG